MSFIDFYRRQNRQLPIALTSQDCQGRTYIVTGSNNGLGYECTKHLVRLGAARVIMAVRNIEAGKASQSTIEAETGRRNVLEVWHLDLSSFDSVKAFVKRVESQLDRVDALIENAAVAMDKWVLLEGRETCVTVNVLSTLLMTVLILPYMKRTATNFGIRPRISIIGSNAAFMIEKTYGNLDKNGVFADLNKREKWERSVADVYPLSKLLLHFAYRGLAAQTPVSETGVVINLSNPGVCYSGLTRNVALTSSLPIHVLRMVLGRSTEKGSRTLLYGASAGEGSHGKYLTECAVEDEAMPPWMTDESGQQMQKKIWEEVAEILEKIQPGCLSMIDKN